MNAPLGDTPHDLAGLNVIDADGGKVGTVQQVYRDDATNEPEWITVSTGLFGTKETFVPLAGCTRVDDAIRVPHTKDQIKDAPRMDADGHLEPSEEERLYRHYGLTRSGRGGMGRDTGTGQAGGMGTAAAAGGMGTAGAAGMTGQNTRPEADRPMAGAGAGQMAMSRGGPADADRRSRKEQNPEMTLSEERAEFGVEEHESGHAHLRKHVVTENVSRTVPVTHEEARITREPISEEEARRTGGAPVNLEDGEYDITLHREEPVIRKETRPYERVRLETDRVTEQQEVSTEVRREQLEFDDGVDTATRKGRTGPMGRAGRKETKETGEEDTGHTW
ncbi:PRC and DUF2382 domain-containing protein [Streptomyces purpurogeneiscleroticus]|uniref:PRC and DUF2382 domain-containing protein n=1 Tax=Streptomyces purpurogeneiscleroticus TaxID=68259 RepID=UPI001CBEC13B|nr:PRC and DUF2382 domain-containing protein [Streptomyces purpurogeneiscleroticus]MBZ4015574.1 hypothetical protein [Streptomyces purpurogeneiscleroticus]